MRRGFRSVVKASKIGGSWTPRELRHSFVSLLSANGVPIESIARLVGHSGTAVTEAVYRKELRPVLTDGAEVIGTIFTHNKSAGGLDVRGRPCAIRLRPVLSGRLRVSVPNTCRSSDIGAAVGECLLHPRTSYPLLAIEAFG